MGTIVPPQGPQSQIYPWLGDAKNVPQVFLLTLPKDFKTTTIGKLNPAAMILMVDRDDGVNVRPGMDTELKAGFRVWVAFRGELSCDVVDREVFKKFEYETMIEDALRMKTDEGIVAKLVMLAKNLGKESSITAIHPIFEAFYFPAYCSGASLGPDGLDLRRKFKICVVGFVRQDGRVEWWPSRDEVVHPGDQGLLMKDYEGYTIGQAPIVTEHMDLVGCLQHEPTFREKFDLADGDLYPWQKVA